MIIISFTFKIREFYFVQHSQDCHLKPEVPKTSKILQQQRKSAKHHAEKYYNKSEYQLFSVTICSKTYYALIIYDFIDYMDSLYLHYQKTQRMNIPGSSFAIRQETRFYLLTYEGRNKTRVRQISLIGMKKIHRNERIFRKL